MIVRTLSVLSDFELDPKVPAHQTRRRNAMHPQRWRMHELLVGTRVRRTASPRGGPGQAAEPQKGASPKANAPPSAVTIQ
jgi:hypothetical protein